MNTTLDAHPAPRAVCATAQLLELAFDLGRRRLAAGAAGAGRFIFSIRPAPRIEPPDSPVPVLHLARREIGEAGTAAEGGFSHYCAVLLALCTLMWVFPGNGLAADIIAESHFDDDAESWTTLSETQAAKDAKYEFAGGSNGGGIATATADRDFFAAPVKFLGDQSRSYGGSLRFDLKQTRNSGYTRYWDVRLHSGGRVLVNKLPVPPPVTWTAIEFTLLETHGWVNREAGRWATREEFQDTLAHLEAVWIRSDYSGDSGDRASLDNVQLIGPVPVTGSQPTKLLIVTGEPGATYQIQFAPHLEDVVWQHALSVTMPSEPPPYLGLSILDAPANQFLRAVRLP